MREDKGLVPELRFPEFVGDGEWRNEELGQISLIVSGQSPDGESYNTNGIGIPFYQGKTDYGDLYLRNPTKWTTEPTKFADEDDILMSVRAPVGALNITKQKVSIGRGLASIKAKENKWFLFHFLNNIQSKIIGNGGSVFDSITKSQIEKIAIFIPKNSKEQQKIASCLSSLDDLIAAHSQKLDLLKDHKKGLMQNLFPQAGETLPKIRFPEFVEDGDWVEKVLSKITTAIFDGTHQTPTYIEQGIPFYSVENVVSGNKNKFISKKDYDIATSKYKPKKGDILITRIGKIGFSTIVNWDFEFSIYVTLACIQLPKEIDACFLHSYFQSDIYQKEIFSKSLLNAVPCKINMNELRETKVLLPKFNEQQKIAACLTALDELITAQAAKIDQLQLHKKGLMQGLFPKVG